MFVSVSECVLFACFSFYLSSTNVDWSKFGCFSSKSAKFSIVVRVLFTINLGHVFINKLVNHTCCYCFTSICNWWYQGELGFCCREAEPCTNVYGRVCVYTNLYPNLCPMPELSIIKEKMQWLQIDKGVKTFQ